MDVAATERRDFKLQYVDEQAFLFLKPAEYMSTAYCRYIPEERPKITTPERSFLDRNVPIHEEIELR